MAKRGRTIINHILPHLEAAGGKPITSDTIARKMREDPSRIRDSLQNFQRSYPEGPVERVASGIFRWREEHATPISGAPVGIPVPTEEDIVRYAPPAVATLNGEAQVSPSGHVTQTFDVVTRKSSILVLLDEDGEIWVAKKVQST